MHRQKAAMAVLLSLLLASCTGSRRAQAGPEVLIQADRDFAQATAEHHLEGFRSFLAEEVTSIRPNSPIIRGKEGLAARWAQLLTDPATSITWKPMHAVISETGNMGFTLGSYELMRSSGPSRQQAGSGKYITIWKREAGGAWKVVFDSGVQDTPPK
jgi:ketosteroid isomerase-like protein